MELLYLYQMDCRYCAKQKSIIKELIKEGHNIIKHNVIVDSKIADEYSVESLPTFILIKDSFEVNRWTGFKEKNFILNEMLV
jgi:thiol-disulfide isomerase/thioredoxin